MMIPMMIRQTIAQTTQAMAESYDSYEIYVSPAGIRVCSAGWDQAFVWDSAKPSELQDCWGHDEAQG